MFCWAAIFGFVVDFNIFSAFWLTNLAAVVKQHHVDDDISDRNMAETTLVRGRIAWWRISIIVLGLVVGLSSLLLFLVVLRRFICLLELEHDIAACPSSDSRPPPAL